MEKLSNKDKEDVKDSEERKTLLKTLTKTYSQKNVIKYKLKNIMSIDEQSTKQKKMT